MAGALRALGHGLRCATSQPGAASLQHWRGAAGCYVKANEEVEKWGSRRENIEEEWTWTNTNVIKTLVWAVGIPVATYNFLCYTAHLEDDWAQRKRRDFMFSSGATTTASK